MKENNKVNITLIVVFIFIILSLIGFIVYDKLNDKLVIDNTITTTKSNKDEKYFKIEEFDYKLNDKLVKIGFNYYLLKNPENLSNDEVNNRIENNAVGAYYNSVEVDVSINGNIVKNTNKTIGYDIYNNINKIKEKTNFLTLKDTIQTIKGTDKDYLLVTIYDRHPEVDGNTSPFIVNENGKIIYAFNFSDNTDWSIEDSNSFMKDKGKYFIDTNKIYYTLPDCTASIDNSGEFPKFTINEYSLTISNDKAITEKIGTYKGIIAGGAYCEN